MCQYCDEGKIRKLKYSKTNPYDYINKKYGNVIIIDCYWLYKNGRHRLYADYKCNCGIIKTSIVEHLKQGKIKSCGCLKLDRIRKRNTKHDLYNKNKRIFDIWNNMIQRCENVNNSSYKNYGGRKIKVCEEWHDLENFIKWAYDNGFEERTISDRKNVLSIERIDVNGNYEPSNCKWIPFKEQGKNKRYSGRKPNVWKKVGGLK